MKSIIRLQKSLIVMAVSLGMFGMAANTNEVIAGSSTGSLAVSANVNSNCVIKNTGNAISFGAYDPLVANASSALTATGNFQVKCTKNTASTLALDVGTNASHAPPGSTRAMADGNGDYLGYDLYTSAALTTIWNATNTVAYTASTAAFVTENVYGSAPGGQNVGAGNYTDTVTITVNF